MLVLLGKQWMPAHSMPLSSHRKWRGGRTDYMAHVIHNQNLFILKGQTPSLQCDLDTLLATAKFGSITSPSESVWREFAVPAHSCHLLSLGNCLVAMGNIDPNTLGPRVTRGLCGNALAHLNNKTERTPKICAYSTLTQTWVQVGDIPCSYQHSLFSGQPLAMGDGFVVYFLREELVVALRGNDGQQPALKASVKGKT